MNGLIYCEECNSTRDENILCCPGCVGTFPRWKRKFISTAGTTFVYDRWLSRNLTTEEIVDYLNSLLDSLQLAHRKD